MKNWKELKKIVKEETEKKERGSITICFFIFESQGGVK